MSKSLREWEMLLQSTPPDLEKEQIRNKVLLEHSKDVTDRFDSEMKSYYINYLGTGEQRANNLIEHMFKNSKHIQRLLLHECFYQDVKEFVTVFDK